MFAKQFFGKISWVVILVVAAMHAIAIPLQHAQTPSLIALMLMGILVAVISWRSLSTGLLIAFAEIMVGGHGHLIDASVGGFAVSLRIVIFAAVMFAWLILLLQRRVTPKFFPYRDIPFLMLGTAVVIATATGVLHNTPGNMFDDMNGYLTILYILPMVSVLWDQNFKRQLLHVLCGSAAWIAVSTLLAVFLFTHLPGLALHDVYRFVRDARLAEVTLLTTPSWFVGHLLSTDAPWYFRVFAPGQFFTLATALLLGAARFVLWRDGKMPIGARILFSLCAATFIASLSRSFFLGAFVGGTVMFVTVIANIPRPLMRNVRHITSLTLLTFFGIGLFWGVIAFPWPHHPDLRDAAFYQEESGDARGMAVSSRWNLLYPMWEAIIAHPIVGNGFGTEVTFISDDPRVREITPTGEWTTYRFEWGYQDIWLKMGLLGLAAFIAYAIVLTQAFRFTVRTQGNRWIAIGLYSGAVALFAAHAFSPYLNHPIGLGFMLFILPFFDWKGTLSAIEVKDRQRVHVSLAMPRPIAAMHKD